MVVIYLVFDAYDPEHPSWAHRFSALPLLIRRKLLSLKLKFRYQPTDLLGQPA
jgi:hypothetical protein